MRRSAKANSEVLLVCLGLLAAGVHLACRGEPAANLHRLTAADIERWMTEFLPWKKCVLA